MEELCCQVQFTPCPRPPCLICDPVSRPAADLPSTRRYRCDFTEVGRRGIVRPSSNSNRPVSTSRRRLTTSVDNVDRPASKARCPERTGRAASFFPSCRPSAHPRPRSSCSFARTLLDLSQTYSMMRMVSSARPSSRSFAALVVGFLHGILRERRPLRSSLSTRGSHPARPRSHRLTPLPPAWVMRQSRR